MANKTQELIISSPAFAEGGDIPALYTCKGEDVNPELRIAGIPEDAVTLALIVEDPDAPGVTFDHWVVWNIERTAVIRERFNPGINGVNSAGRTGYHGPCPPSGKHRYYFRVYALDSHLDLSPGVDKAALQAAMEGHVLAEGVLMGRFG